MLLLLHALLRMAPSHVPHDEIMALSVAQSGSIVLSYCEVRGMYRSTDGGLNWELVWTGLPDCLQGDIGLVYVALCWLAWQVSFHCHQHTGGWNVYRRDA